MNVTKNLCGFSLADFSHLPNLLYYLRGRPGGPPYPVGGPLGGFQKEPTFPIYNITFMTGKVGHPSRFS